MKSHELETKSLFVQLVVASASLSCNVCFDFLLFDLNLYRPFNSKMNYLNMKILIARTVIKYMRFICALHLL